MSFTTVRFDHLSVVEIRNKIIPWCAANILPGGYIYTWPSPCVMCSKHEDAMMLVLLFDGKREFSKVEKLIHEENNDRR